MSLQLADRWFETRRLRDGITQIWEPHVAPDTRCNIWHVRGRDRDLLVDTGTGLVPVRAVIEAENEIVCVATHTHFDHIGGFDEFDVRLLHRAEQNVIVEPTQANTTIAGWVTIDRFDALPYAGFDPNTYGVEATQPTRLVDEGDVIALGDRAFEVLM